MCFEKIQVGLSEWNMPVFSSFLFFFFLIVATKFMSWSWVIYSKGYPNSELTSLLENTLLENVKEIPMRRNKEICTFLFLSQGNNLTHRKILLRKMGTLLYRLQRSIAFKKKIFFKKTILHYNLEFKIQEPSKLLHKILNNSIVPFSSTCILMAG